MIIDATISLLRMFMDIMSLILQFLDTGQITNDISSPKRGEPIKNKGTINCLFDRDTNYKSKRVALCLESRTAAEDIWGSCGREAAWFVE